MIIQQGDVILEKVDKNPGDEYEEIKSRVLAEGEATGHAHRLAPDSRAKLMKAGAMLMLVVSEASKIAHEEHLPVTVPPGVWKVRKVLEYDHFDEEAREVVD